jgi:hypothetical protein
VKILEVDLFSPAWEVRHGAAMALRELLKVQGKCGGMRGIVFFCNCWMSAGCADVPLKWAYLVPRTSSSTKTGATNLPQTFSAYSYSTDLATLFLTKYVNSVQNI